MATASLFYTMVGSQHYNPGSIRFTDLKIIPIITLRLVCNSNVSSYVALAGLNIVAISLKLSVWKLLFKKKGKPERNNLRV